MVEYIEEFSSELDASELELEEAMDSLTEDWDTDEMIDLLAECEFVLSYNEGRIEQLKASGLKRIVHIITGVNRKNKFKVCENVQEIQKIAFKIQKIILKRIDLECSAVISLDNKLNQQIFWTNEVINNLYQKLENLPDMQIDIKLLRWQNKVRYLEAKSGKKYLEVSDGLKILLVVSDLFQIVHNRSGLVDRPFLETILKDRLEMHDQISVSEFYDCIIDEKESLSLYINGHYEDWAEKASAYGQTIYKIGRFYTDEHMKEMAGQKNISMNEMCKKVYADKSRDRGEKIGTVELCQILLKDLACLDASYQAKIGGQKQPEQPKVTEQEKIPGDSSVTEPEKKNSNSTEYSVLRVTPEGFWLFEKGNVRPSKIEPGKKYTFSDEGIVKTYLESISPYIVITSDGYFDKCVPEIKNILSSGMKYISLADYYMYLWFRRMNVDERKSKKVVFVEYYDHDMYVSGYDVDPSGTSYQKRFPKPRLVIHYNKTREHIKTLILNAMCNSDKMSFWHTLEWEDLLCFKTFTVDKPFDKRLLTIGVRMVDNTWEDILKTDNDNLGDIIRDMVDKAAERP